MWQIFVEPVDVLLFRDGRPFTAGEDHRARSMFPPTPFTMQGMLRSKILFESGVSPTDYAGDSPSPTAQRLRELIGTPRKSYGKLRLRGPFVARKGDDDSLTRYFPMPADVLEIADEQEKSHKTYTFLKPLVGHPFRSNAPPGVELLWPDAGGAVKETYGWLAESEFRKYLAGQTDFHVTEEVELLVREPRFGIALDPSTRRPREGLLYQMEFLRLKEGTGFLLEVDGVPPFQAESGFVQLGGEARVARYRILPSPLPPLPLSNPLPTRFKVVLLTPAWFSGGWQPKDGNWGKFFSGGAPRLVAAAIRRAQPIGGAFVDNQHRKESFQKVMRRFVPAGSVYFFESDGTLTYIGKPFTETPLGEGDFGQIGFGCVAIGEWDYTRKEG